MLLRFWASTVPYLEALLGNANKCVEVSEPCSPQQQPADLSCIAHSQLHITHSRVFVEQKVMAPVRAELLQQRCCSRDAAVHGPTMFTGGNRHGRGIWGPGELVYPWDHTPVHTRQRCGGTMEDVLGYSTRRLRPELEDGLCTLQSRKASKD